MAEKRLSLSKKIAGGCLLGFFLFFSIQSNLGASSPSLLIPATVHQFGDLARGEKVEHAFVLKNQGKEKISLKAVNFIGPLTTAKVKNEVLPGQEGKVILVLETYDLTGEVVAGAIIQTSDPARPSVEFKLTGRIKAPAIEIRPMPAVFVAAFQGEPKEKKLTIQNNEEKLLDILGLETESKRFQAQLHKVKEGKEFEVVVRVTPEAGLGKTTEPLIIVTDHPQFPEIKIPVNIYVKGDVYSFPEAVDWGKLHLKKLVSSKKKNRNLEQSLMQSILVKRRPGKGTDFQITIQHGIPFIAIQKTPDRDSDTYRLDITPILEKMKPGKIDTFIKVKTNDKDVPELKISVVGEVL